MEREKRGREGRRKKRKESVSTLSPLRHDEKLRLALSPSTSRIYFFFLAFFTTLSPCRLCGCSLKKTRKGGRRENTKSASPASFLFLYDFDPEFDPDVAIHLLGTFFSLWRARLACRNSFKTCVQTVCEGGRSRPFRRKSVHTTLKGDPR